METKAQIIDSVKIADGVSSKAVEEHLNVDREYSFKIRPFSKEITVFLVDDDPLFLKALKHSISVKHPSITIKTFQTGEACLEQMKTKPDVVILDYYLNSEKADALDGLSVLKKIKKISSKSKVIMLSAQDSLEIAMKCIDYGIYDYISKSESAFVKLNNTLSNTIEEIKLNDTFFKPYQIIVLIFIIVLLIKLLL